MFIESKLNMLYVRNESKQTDAQKLAYNQVRTLANRLNLSCLTYCMEAPFDLKAFKSFQRFLNERDNYPNIVILEAQLADDEMFRCFLHHHYLNQGMLVLLVGSHDICNAVISRPLCPEEQKPLLLALDEKHFVYDDHSHPVVSCSSKDNSRNLLLAALDESIRLNDSSLGGANRTNWSLLDTQNLVSKKAPRMVFLGTTPLDGEFVLVHFRIALKASSFHIAIGGYECIPFYSLVRNETYFGLRFRKNNLFVVSQVNVLNGETHHQYYFWLTPEQLDSPPMPDQCLEYTEAENAYLTISSRGKTVSYLACIDHDSTRCQVLDSLDSVRLPFGVDIDILCIDGNGNELCIPIRHGDALLVETSEWTESVSYALEECKFSTLNLTDDKRCHLIRVTTESAAMCNGLKLCKVGDLFFLAECFSVGRQFFLVTTEDLLLNNRPEGILKLISSRDMSANPRPQSAFPRSVRCIARQVLQDIEPKPLKQVVRGNRNALIALDQLVVGSRNEPFIDTESLIKVLLREYDSVHVVSCALPSATTLLETFGPRLVAYKVDEAEQCLQNYDFIARIAQAISFDSAYFCDLDSLNLLLHSGVFFGVPHRVALLRKQISLLEIADLQVQFINNLHLGEKLADKVRDTFSSIEYTSYNPGVINQEQSGIQYRLLNLGHVGYLSEWLCPREAHVNKSEKKILVIFPRSSSELFEDYVRKDGEGTCKFESLELQFFQFDENGVAIAGQSSIQKRELLYRALRYADGVVLCKDDTLTARLIDYEARWFTCLQSIASQKLSNNAIEEALNYFLNETSQSLSKDQIACRKENISESDEPVAAITNRPLWLLEMSLHAGLLDKQIKCGSLIKQSTVSRFWQPNHGIEFFKAKAKKHEKSLTGQKDNILVYEGLLSQLTGDTGNARMIAKRLAENGSYNALLHYGFFNLLGQEERDFLAPVFKHLVPSEYQLNEGKFLNMQLSETDFLRVNDANILVADQIDELEVPHHSWQKDGSLMWTLGKYAPLHVKFKTEIGCRYLLTLRYVKNRRPLGRSEVTYRLCLLGQTLENASSIEENNIFTDTFKLGRVASFMEGFLPLSFEVMNENPVFNENLEQVVDLRRLGLGLVTCSISQY